MSQTLTRSASFNTVSTLDTLRNVEIFVLFLSIGEIDTMNEKFTAELIIESKWTESSIQGEYDPKNNWNPKLYIENALSDAKETISYSMDRNHDHVTVIEIRHVKGSFWERLELDKFPFDIQELSVTITSKYHRSELNLVSNYQNLSYLDPEALNTFRDQQKWRLYQLVKITESVFNSSVSCKSLQVKFSNDKKRSFIHKTSKPKFIASLFCSRKHGFYLLNAFLMNFLITLISLTNFSIEIGRPQNRLSGTFTLILTSISFKWVTNRSLPTISYMTSLDKYQIASILFMCLECFWHALVNRIFKPNLAIGYDRISFSIYLCCFTLIQFYFLIIFYLDFRSVKALKSLEKKCLLKKK